MSIAKAKLAASNGRQPVDGAGPFVLRTTAKAADAINMRSHKLVAGSTSLTRIRIGAAAIQQQATASAM
jgi:hypothetical protein